MPIQVPRARANLMKNKDLSKVQSEKTLTGAVKAFNNTFCAYKEVEREYYDKQGTDKNKKLSEEKNKRNCVCFYLILKFVPFRIVVI